MTDIDELVRVARYVGGRADYVQGGGGNVSVKAAQGAMHIKASGGRLDAMDRTHGHVAVDHHALRSLMDDIQDEDDYQRQLARLCSGQGRASIETGFHALLGRVVIHSHSIYANVLTCAMHGREILSDIFPDALFVPYATPGWDVTRAMYREMAGVAAPEVVFLQSHGLIVAADSADEAISLHEHVNRELMYRMSIDAQPVLQQVSREADWRYIWPDQVVYADVPDSEAAIETFAAARFVLAQQRRLGLETRWLEPEELARLRWLESEKYRQKALAS